MSTCLIAHAADAYRQRIRQGLEQRGLTVVAEASTVDEALALAVREDPDLCLVSMQLPGGGLAAVARIVKAVPATAVVVLAVESAGGDVVAALERGALGYLPEDVGDDELAASLRAAAKGEPALSRALVPLLVDHVRRGTRRRVVLPSGAVQLTAREWDVGELLRDGHPTREIAARLGLSPVTVRRHVALLMKKLGAADRSAAVETLKLFSR
jgi:two-component system, NarL family, nitrate/nitrite response regulator NarL